MNERPISVVYPDTGQIYTHIDGLSCKIPSHMTNNAYTILKLQLQPGQGSALHFHQCEDEVIIVQEGFCTVSNQEQSWEIGPGGCVVFPKLAAHSFQNNSTALCTLLITAIPGGLDEYFAAINIAISQQHVQSIPALNEQYGITFM